LVAIAIRTGEDTCATRDNGAWWRESACKGMVAENAIRDLCERIVREFQPERIIGQEKIQG
jgi:hypothetical protein